MLNWSGGPFFWHGYQGTKAMALLVMFMEPFKPDYYVVYDVSVVDCNGTRSRRIVTADKIDDAKAIAEYHFAHKLS